MALSTIDRILIQRTQEAMERVTSAAEFRALADDGRRATGRCPAPGCTTPTNGGPCKRHWRMRNQNAPAMSDPTGRTRR